VAADGVRCRRCLTFSTRDSRGLGLGLGYGVGVARIKEGDEGEEAT
jgi:hypothetical protein